MCTTCSNMEELCILSQGVFMWFVWSSELTTIIISLYSINWLVFITERNVFTARYVLLSAHTAYLCVLCGSENTQRFSLYSINWLAFITERSVFTARYVLHPTFCPHSVFMCFVWIWEQTAIISLYSINWPVFITERECVTARYGMDLWI